METDAAREQIQELRQGHIGRLFLEAHRAFSARAVEKLSTRGHRGLGLAQTALLAHLDLDGTRITTLADRAGMTKQGMGQLAAELARQGYVATGPDPTDRRATLVTFTDDGWRFLRDAYAVKQEIEAEYAAVLGEERFEALRAALSTLLKASGRPNPGGPVADPAGEGT